VGTIIIRPLPADIRRVDYSVQTGTAASDLEGVQIPLRSLLLATVLTGSLWWGIIAGMRWVWRAL
jgi:hypothetical protein